MADVNPKISIIIPVYNVEKYIEECLNSILLQSLHDIEIICINDGSTDKSLEMLYLFQQKDNRITVVSQNNMGQGAARNVGIRLARGKYICFLDSDDMLLDNALESLYYTAAKADLHIVSFETVLKYEDDKLRNDSLEKYYIKENKYPGIMEGKYFFEQMVTNKEYCDSACFLFIKREWMLSENIFFPEGVIYEDVMFALLCFLKAKAMQHLSVPYYVYRIREKSTMTKRMNVFNLYSRLCNLKSLLSVLFSIPHNDVLILNAVIKYIEQIRGSIQYIDYIRDDKEKKCNVSPMINLMQQFSNVGTASLKCNSDIILAGIEKVVGDSNGVVLYGAGVVGRNVYNFICLKGLQHKVKCFAVSDKDKDTEDIFGKPVLHVFDQAIRDNLVFICAKEDYQEDMEHNLFIADIKNYMIMDSNIRRAINGYIASSEENN